MPEKTITTATATISITAMLLGALLVCPGCGQASSDQGGRQVFVSIAPLGYFATRIAGKHISVSVLIGPDSNPHTYSPSPRQIVKLNQGGLLLCAGSGVERIISSKLRAGRKLRIVNLAAGIGHDHHGHDHHGHDHAAHDHCDEDPHVWLSPQVAKKLAAGICAEFCKLDPPHSNEYKANLRQLQEELDSLDARIAATLKPVEGKTIFVFHPAFGHFAGTYGLKQKAVEDHGKSPGPKHITKLIATAKTAKATVVFVQPQFSQRAAQVMATAIGARVVPLDPLSPDYVKNLEHIAREIRKALQSQDH